MDAAIEWAKAHRRIIALKCAVAAMLVISHYFPGHPAGVIVNLIWLFLF